MLTAYRQRGGLKWLATLPDKQFLALMEKVLAKDLAAELKMKPEEQEQRPINIVVWTTPSDGSATDNKPQQLAATNP